MTVVVHSTTKNATGAIKYARDGIDKQTGEQKCVAMSGFQADMSNAEYQFSAVRKAYGKENGIQARIFIQSFENGLAAETANEIGLETVKRFNDRIDGTYQAVIYTHGNTDSPHNHIVINSVNPENGLKYHVQRDLELFREVSDEVSLEFGIEKPEPSKVKESFAENKLREQGAYVWKDDLRQQIDEITPKATSFNDFKEKLAEEKNIDVIQRGSQYTFSFVDETGISRKARSKRLGKSYEPDELEPTFGIKTPETSQKEAQDAIRDTLIRYVSTKLSDFDSTHYNVRMWEEEFEKLNQSIGIEAIDPIDDWLVVNKDYNPEDFVGHFYHKHIDEIESMIDDVNDMFDEYDLRENDLEFYNDRAVYAMKRVSGQLQDEIARDEFIIPEKDESLIKTPEMSQQQYFIRPRGFDFER